MLLVLLLKQPIRAQQLCLTWDLLETFGSSGPGVPGLSSSALSDGGSASVVSLLGRNRGEPEGADSPSGDLSLSLCSKLTSRVVGPRPLVSLALWSPQDHPHCLLAASAA